MSFNVATDVTGQAIAIYPDLTPANALYYLNQVRADVMRRLSLHLTTSTISLTAGTQEYLLDATAVRVELVEYRRSAAQSDFMALLPTTLAEVEQQENRFHGYTYAEPRRFYLSEGANGPLIGFIPAPATTTSAGYPIVTVYENTVSVLGATDTFTDDLPSTEVYITGIAMKWAERQDLKNYAARKALYEAALTDAQDYLYKKNTNYATRLYPSWIRRRGVV